METPSPLLTARQAIVRGPTLQELLELVDRRLGPTSEEGPVTQIAYQYAQTRLFDGCF